MGDGVEGDIGWMRVGRDDSARVTELGSDFWTGGSGLGWKIPEVPQVWLEYHWDVAPHCGAWAVRMPLLSRSLIRH